MSVIYQISCDCSGEFIFMLHIVSDFPCIVLLVYNTNKQTNSSMWHVSVVSQYVLIAFANSTVSYKCRWSDKKLQVI